MDNKNMNAEDGILFAAVPDTDEIDKLAPIELDGLSEDEIEKAAIASLPFGEGEESLDSLIINDDEHIVAYETPEEARNYELFLADYKNIVATMLANARVESEQPSESEAVNTETKKTSEAETASEEAEQPRDTNNADMPVKNVDEVKDTVDAEITEPADAYENEYTAADNNAAADDATDEISESEQSGERVRVNAEDYIRLIGEIEYPADDAVAEDEASADDEGEQLQMDFGTDEWENEAAEEEKAPVRDINKYDEDNPRKIDSIFEFLELFVFTLLAVMVVTTFFFRQSVVDGDSMNMTLEHGDRLIMYSFMYTPKYGDIVVFEDFSTGEKKPLVKRVIGLKGDKITVTEQGRVIRNGELLDEDYIFFSGDNDKIAYGTWTVGEGEVFVVGDHRDNSKDSREFGPVDSDGILGKVIFRFYPFSNIGAVE